MPYVPPGVTPMTVLHPEAGWEYRWLASDPDRLSGHLVNYGDRPGYTIVQGKNVPETKEVAKKLGFPATMVNELTNRIMYGTMILAKLPSVEAERRRKELMDMARWKQGKADETAMAKMEGRGVRPFVAPLEEIQDRREFAQREGGGRVSLSGLDPRAHTAVPADAE